MTIHLIATGGTIASLPDETGALKAAMTAEDLIAGVPQLDRYQPITCEEVTRVNGWNVSPSDMLEVARRLGAALDADDVDGAIITGGTDTIEETAFLVDVTMATDKPVCLAAAMRGGAEISADGPRNLLNAAMVASEPAARGIGAALVLNDEIHAARWVTKLDSFRMGAFGSPDHGPLGTVTPAGASIRTKPSVRVTVDLPERLSAPVPVVKTYTGMEEDLIPRIVEVTNASGLVVEGTGLGNVPGTAMPGIEAAVDDGVAVVVATRVPAGGTKAVYGGPGGGAALERLGVPGAQGLTAAKARLLLMLLLSAGHDAVSALERLGEAARALA
ncbi:MAG TPA: asparaginase [Actinomycetota bacterium]|nr:asparaginase [Actinomycetota bacterium]